MSEADVTHSAADRPNGLQGVVADFASLALSVQLARSGGAPQSNAATKIESAADC